MPAISYDDNESNQLDPVADSDGEGGEDADVQRAASVSGSNNNGAWALWCP